MRADTFSRLPFQAGQAVAAGSRARRAVGYRGLHARAAAQYRHCRADDAVAPWPAPTPSISRSGHHPAPLFGSFDGTAAPRPIAPVMPLERPGEAARDDPPPETTGSVGQVVEPHRSQADRQRGRLRGAAQADRVQALRRQGRRALTGRGPRARSGRSRSGRPEADGPADACEIIELIKATPITAELKTEAVVVEPVAGDGRDQAPSRSIVLTAGNGGIAARPSRSLAAEPATAGRRANRAPLRGSASPSQWLRNSDVQTLAMTVAALPRTRPSSPRLRSRQPSAPVQTHRDYAPPRHEVGALRQT